MEAGTKCEIDRLWPRAEMQYGVLELSEGASLLEQGWYDDQVLNVQGRGDAMVAIPPGCDDVELHLSPDPVSRSWTQPRPRVNHPVCTPCTR